MAANFDRIEAPVMIGVGAAFDFWLGPRLRRQSGCSAAAWNGCFVSLPSQGDFRRRYVIVVPTFLCLGARELLLRRLMKLQKA